MRKFELSEAIKGAKLVTRDGRAARLLAYDVNSRMGSLVVATTNPIDGYEQVDQYHKDGKFWSDISSSNFDLFLADDADIKTPKEYKYIIVLIKDTDEIVRGPYNKNQALNIISSGVNGYKFHKLISYQ